MAINYHVQELPDLHDEGKQYLFPKAETYSVFGNKKMVERIALESGLQEGAVMAVLDALPKALKNIMLEGHTCKIEGLGTFSLSLTFSENETVRINRMNLKVDKALLNELREKVEFIKVQTEVVQVASSKKNFDEHLNRLNEWFASHKSITLQEYANLIGVSCATASRELKKICAIPSNKIMPFGSRVQRIWIKK